MSKTELHNKTVLITGAANGIGRATAMAFARQGCHLLLVDIKQAALLDCASACEAANEAILVETAVVDLADIHALPAVVRQLSERNPIDILINNAGVSYGGRFEDQDLELIERLVQINLQSVIGLSRVVLDVMKKQSAGHIINISSPSAIVGAPGYAVYAATKAGITAFTEILNREMSGRSIRVSVFYPGMTQTPATHTLLENASGTSLAASVSAQAVAAGIVRLAQYPKQHSGIASRQQWLIRSLMWLNRCFPRLVDRVWRTQATDQYYDLCAQVVTVAKQPHSNGPSD